MHKHELIIDTNLATRLIASQCEQWQGLPIQKLSHAGTDNAIFKLGDDKCIRLPRIASAAEQLIKEIEWLPRLAPHLPLKIPTPLANGTPCDHYPFHWYVYEWIDGTDAYNSPPHDVTAIVKKLANFINALHQIDISHAPETRRGKPLSSQDPAVRQSIRELPSSYDTKRITALWESALKTPDWQNAPVWLHGDLLPQNMLLKNGELKAIIDFGLAGIGDPACDLIPAWNLLDAASREIFKNQLNVDDNTWLRGKGWALAIAVVIIPYYLETNPQLVSVANRMTEALTAE